jgi:hypothetical protein
MTFDHDEDGGLGGALISTVINALEGSLRDTIEAELNGFVCDEVGKLDGAFDDLLTETSEWIDDLFLRDDNAEVDDFEVVDPLSAEREADVPTDEGGLPMWIDFVEMRDLVRELTGLESMDQLAQKIMGDGGGVSDIVDAFLRGSGILDDDGLLVVDPSVVFDSGSSSSFLEFQDMFTRTRLSVTSVSVGGLDSLVANGTSVLDPIGRYTLRNSLRFDRLAFALGVRAEMRPSSESSGAAAAANDIDDSPVVRENFTIGIGMRDVLVTFSLFLGANNGTLDGMPLGSIIDFENILPCVLTAVEDAKITEVVVTASDVEAPTLYGLDDADGGTGYLVTAVADALFDVYGQVLSNALPSFLAATVKDVATDYINDRMDDDACPKPDDSLTGLVDYRDLLLSEEGAVELMGRGGSPYGGLFRYLYDFVKGKDGMSRLNELIVTVLGLDSNDEGGIVLAADLFKRNFDISLNGLNAVIEIAISNVTVSNLDSLDVIKLAMPMMGESSVLDNEVSLGVGPDPIRLSLTLLLKGKVDNMEFDNEVELVLSLVDIDMALQVLAQMKELSLMNFPLEDVTDLNCWISTIVTPLLDKFGTRVGEQDSGLVLRNLAIVVEEARLDMKCIRCTDTAVIEIEQLMQSEDGIADATDIINKVFDYGSDILQGDYIQNVIDRMLNNATYNCPHNPSYQHDFPGLVYQSMPVVKTDAPSYGFLFAIIAVIAAVAVSAAVIFFVARLMSRRRHNRWMRTLNQDKVRELDRLEREERALKNDLDQRIKSLFMSREVPCFVRYLIPVVILGNVALFLSGHLSLGGTVNISGNVGEQEFDVVGFYEFSMVNSSK